MINSKKSNIIVGCLYEHPIKDVYDFNKNYLNTFLDKLPKRTSNFFVLLILILACCIPMIINLQMNFILSCFKFIYIIYIITK